MPFNSNTDVTFMLVEDHPMMRHAIGSVIESVPNWRIIESLGMPSEAIRAMRRRVPDVVIVDLVFDDESGLSLLEHMRSHFPGIRSIVYSARNEAHYAERCIRAGAVGYVTKDEPAEALLDAIRRALSGQVYVNESIAADLLGSILRNGGHPGDELIEQLSDRELEVFQLIGRGLSTRGIADAICRSVKTVETYRHRIKRKLHVENGVQLAQLAARHAEWPGVQQTKSTAAQ